MQIEKGIVGKLTDELSSERLRNYKLEERVKLLNGKIKVKDKRIKFKAKHNTKNIKVIDNLRTEIVKQERYISDVSKQRYIDTNMCIQEYKKICTDLRMENQDLIDDNLRLKEISGKLEKRVILLNAKIKVKDKRIKKNRKMLDVVLTEGSTDYKGSDTNNRYMIIAEYSKLFNKLIKDHDALKNKNERLSIDNWKYEKKLISYRKLDHFVKNNFDGTVEEFTEKCLNVINTSNEIVSENDKLREEVERLKESNIALTEANSKLFDAKNEPINEKLKHELLLAKEKIQELEVDNSKLEPSQDLILANKSYKNANIMAMREIARLSNNSVSQINRIIEIGEVLEQRNGVIKEKCNEIKLLKDTLDKTDIELEDLKVKLHDAWVILDSIQLLVQ